MAERKRFLIDTMKTPLGVATVIADEAGALRLYRWDDPPERWRKDVRRRYGDAALVAYRNPFGHVAALERYFEGDIAAIDAIPVTFTGTPFQVKVWKALRTIA